VKIAFDITILYIAAAGVFYYHHNLIQAMLALPSTHEFILLDYFPVEGEWARQNPPEVHRLLAKADDLRRVKGVKHRKLARVGFVRRRGLLPVANWLDRQLDGAWRGLTQFEMRRRLREHLADVDVFHTSDVVNCALPGAKSVTTIHDLTAVLFPQYHTRQVRETLAEKFRFAQTQADAVICVSESAKRDAVEYLELDPARVHVVHHGVDPSFCPLPPASVADALRPMGLMQEGYILHVGTIEPRKNLVRLVQAYQRLCQRLQTTPRLVLAGMKGWLYEDVLTEVEALGLEDRVILAGHVDGELLPALYNGARLFVYPSLYEGFGLPVLEAMACGVPVVTSNTSSLPEVAGDAAMLVDPYDVTGIAEAMEQILGDNDRVTTLRRRGLARAARFTWEAAARETLKVYGKIQGVG
jgi:glycosyltransferase involved in cell wall biosynthesis